MSCPDGDSKRVYSGLLYKIHRLLDVGIHICRTSVAVRRLAYVSKLRLNADALGMCDVHYDSRAAYVLLIGQRRSINHNVCEAAVDRINLGLEIGTVVKVEAHRHINALCHGDDHGQYIFGMGKLGHLAASHLNYDRGVFLVRGLDDRARHLHVHAVHRHDRVTVTIGVKQHLLHVDKHQANDPFLIEIN